MNILTGKNLAVVLIAGLLILANVENHADEIDSYLNNAMRAQVLEELQENMRRMYEDTGFIHTAVRRDSARAGSLGFPIAAQRTTDLRPYRVGVVN